ncbi:MAG: hypothetical protein JW909_08070 [Planctomycetes bacterium]|nr:hypothetical protein [Planctomycetota bacterium]
MNKYRIHCGDGPSRVKSGAWEGRSRGPARVVLLAAAAVFLCRAACGGDVSVPLELLVPAGTGSRPVIAGGVAVFPKGKAKGTAFYLSADGEPVPASITVRALWPDGSAMAVGIEAYVRERRAGTTWAMNAAAYAPPHRKLERITHRAVDTRNGRALVVESGGHRFLVPAKGGAPFLEVDTVSEDGTAFAVAGILEKGGAYRKFSTETATGFDSTRAYVAPDGLSLQVFRKGYMRATVAGADLPGEPLLMAPYGNGEGCAVVLKEAVKLYPVSGAFRKEIARRFDGEGLTAGAVDTGTGTIYVSEKTGPGAELWAIEPADVEQGTRVMELPFAPKRLAAFKGILLAEDAGGVVTAFRAGSADALWRFKPEGEILEIAAGRGAGVVLVKEKEAHRTYARELAKGDEVSRNTFWEFAPPYALSPDGRYIAHRRGNGLVVMDAVSGDPVSSAKVTPWAVAFSPGGRLLALQPCDEKTGAAGSSIVVVAAAENKVLLSQETKEGFAAAGLAVDDNGRVLAAAGGGVLNMADTGAWPYRTVYRFWSGAPLVEIEHALFLDGDPDTEFLASAEMHMSVPTRGTGSVRVPGDLPGTEGGGIIYRPSGERGVFLSDDSFCPRQPRGIRSEPGRLVYELYPGKFKRPADLRRYAKHVFTGPMYGEYPMWGTRSGQGTGLFASFRVGIAAKGEEPARGAFMPAAAAAAASRVWGEFMPHEESAREYPVLTRFNDRLFRMATDARGHDQTAFDYGDFPGVPLGGDYLFQGAGGWRNGEHAVLQGLVAQLLYKPEYGRFMLMQENARHMYTVDLTRFADGKGEYWRAGSAANGSIRSGGVQHWSGRAGDVRRIGNAAGLMDYYIISGDVMAREAAEEVMGFAMRAKGARFEVLALFDMASCAAHAEGDMEEARRTYEYAKGTIEEMPRGYSGMLAALYICPQMFRHHEIFGDAASVELLSTLSPMQGGANPENLLNRSLYLGMTGNIKARIDVQRYAGIMARLPLSGDRDFPEEYARQVEGLQRLYPYLVERGFAVGGAMPYMLKVLKQSGIREEDMVR